MLYQYKLYKYQQKNKLLIGGNRNEITPQKQHLIVIFIELYDKIIDNQPFIGKNIAISLQRLVSKHMWLHIPSIEDVGYDIFSKPNHFNVTDFWHDVLQPHSGNPDKTICNGCSSLSKLDQRSSNTNPYISHHVDQHLFRISTEYLYTYNLVTCSTLILMQNGYIGMMHIDAGNNYDDIMEFINTFEETVGNFDRTLQIHGFLNGEIFDDINNDTLLPIYCLISNQYKIFGHSIFSNIWMNLPQYFTDKQYISMTLYIFAIPNGQIKGFYCDVNSNVEQYSFEVRPIKIYEQQLPKPQIIVDRLKEYLPTHLLIELIDYIGTHHEITEKNLYDLLEYTIAPFDDVNGDNILKLKQFLINHDFDPNYFLLEINNI